MNRVLVNSTGSVSWTSPNTGRNAACRTTPTVPRNTSAPLAAITHNPANHAVTEVVTSHERGRSTRRSPTAAAAASRLVTISPSSRSRATAASSENG